jgi:hypothetical protein
MLENVVSAGSTAIVDVQEDKIAITGRPGMPDDASGGTAPAEAGGPAEEGKETPT